MRNVTVAVTQMACTMNRADNLRTADTLVRQAAAKGANIILLQELFETLYFCQSKDYELYRLASTVEENPAIRHFSSLAKELRVVLPISFYEAAGNTTFNSVAVIDADGAILGIYRKTHIPDDHFYQEKFYFSPGDTGFQVWNTAYGRIGVGICWDQWFPEAARCMALLGAELLFYPTAIGSEPVLECDSMPHWQRCMQGHAAANIIPVIASNRIGTEDALTFYGSSFIADETGALVTSLDRKTSCCDVASFDLDAIAKMRMSWGVFRDRRPEMYSPLLKLS